TLLYLSAGPEVQPGDDAWRVVAERDAFARHHRRHRLQGALPGLPLHRRRVDGLRWRPELLHLLAETYQGGDLRPLEPGQGAESQYQNRDRDQIAHRADA